MLIVAIFYNIIIYNKKDVIKNYIINPHIYHFDLPIAYKPTLSFRPLKEVVVEPYPIRVLDADYPF